MNRFTLLLAVLVAATVGCTNFDTSPPPQPLTMNQAYAAVSNKTPTQARQHLEAVAAKGETVGDLATPEAAGNLVVMADSIVVGLDGRGTARYDPKMRSYLVKLLVKNYDSLDIASQIINSKDAAPVRVVAELPPFVHKGDKFDVVVQSLDPTVNIEGGTLVDTPLQRYVDMGIPKPTGGFSTPGGLVSEGTQAYARGDVTLNAGYRAGVALKGEAPTLGYIPAGAMAEQTWAYRLMLKTPDANTSLLMDRAIKERFNGNLEKIITSPNVSFLAVSLPVSVLASQGGMTVDTGRPSRYKSYWKRYLDVLVRIPVRPAPRQERLARIEQFAAGLASADPSARYDAECSLEAYGPESAGTLLEAVGTSNVSQRQSALRVLAFLGDVRATAPLADESRRARGSFRTESAYLLSMLGGDVANQRLVEMLSDPEPMARFEALLAIERVGYQGAPVRTYYSGTQRSFAMYLVDAPGEKCVVVKSIDGVRRIALFGSGIRVKQGFRGGVGPVTLNVGADSTEILHKRSTGGPATIRTVDVQYIVSSLDRMNVSVNDIIGVLSLLNQQGALDVKLYWAD